MTFQDLTKTPIRNGGTSGMWNSANNTKQVIVIHDTESGNAAGALSWMRSQQNGSYHVLVDTDGDVFRMVPDNRQSWSAAAKGNQIGLHICATGYASWRLRAMKLVTGSRLILPPINEQDGICAKQTRARKANAIKWMNYPQMLEQIAQQVARWSKDYGIPLVVLSVADVKAGKKGICGHNEISLAFRQSDHTDPGPNFPKQWIVNRAKQINQKNLLGLSDAQLSEVATNLRQLGPT
ncbi:lysin A, N-acetylmuramoyl-L-alanine amidase domain [Gordonia phage Forza]|uniref:N-acetylmuramoyl-L-alanine amidase n=1 Tax=Gordonia phage Forza TaxID=2571247 RepID=A0A650FB08_9CAUD|nr:endolysin [Gordonia phage Forza]QEM41576.1 lysin A, N-acetylmuramoyl-L-alanine amidase domain [Gordonia phage Boopy]QGT55102.1 lysin A, N-acetylmuramoyl-L-alanine amidase domain [Gordonia phage Forza]UXE04250.1 lysin A, N-acetylmuramoyl-L-alanine amidase domain [Gordonia phage BlueNGold]WBF03890.1 lysin A, N-acetylmuramoyl-L-alanine amidase domain [Gordonia phage Mareelih]